MFGCHHHILGPTHDCYFLCGCLNFMLGILTRMHGAPVYKYENAT